jgi:D-psicose/D-tagatose/L-ribulose 3-epimerase
MKIGINMLLWTGQVAPEHRPVFAALKDCGFDGIEIPIFDPSDIAHYRMLGDVLDDLGLERTVTTVMPDAAHDPISPDAASRDGAVEHLIRVIDCCEALGATVLAGPYYQRLGEFSGEAPSEIELDRCASVHRRVAQKARDAGLICAIEPLNRFECHLLNTCQQTSAYLERLSEAGFGILYDTFHANIEEKNPISALHDAFGKGHVNHIHISENDRGTPGRGHAKIRETIDALKTLRYNGWLTIEAFGKGVPELAAATRVWRDFFVSPEEVYSEGYQYIRECLGRN